MREARFEYNVDAFSGAAVILRRCLKHDKRRDAPARRFAAAARRRLSHGLTEPRSP